MILELNKSQSGDWDRFSVRNIGLAVQRSMARRNGRTADKFRTESIRLVTAKLGIRSAGWNEVQLHVLSDFAVVLALIPDLNSWSKNEKESLVKIIRAKADRDEASYLILMQRHARLRREFIKIGSR